MSDDALPGSTRVPRTDLGPDKNFTTDVAALAAEAAGGDPAAPDSGANQVANMSREEREIAEAKLRSQPSKSRADLQREEIQARFTANRDNPTEDESTEPMRVGVMQMLAAGTNPDDRSAPAAPTAAAPAAPAAAVPANSRTDAIANPQSTITIVVDGRQRVVPVEDVLRHGVATLQKETAADIRLQRVSEAEQAFQTRVAAERLALDTRAAEIERIRATTPTGAAPPQAPANLPSGGGRGLEVMNEALNALLDSDVPTAAKSLDQIITDRVEARMRAATPPASEPAPRASTDVRPQTPEAPWNQAECDRANEAVLSATGRLAYDPNFQKTFVARMSAEMNSPVHRAARTDLTTIGLRLATEIVSGGFTPAPPQPAVNGVTDELAARRTLAARVPGMPSSAAPRTVSTAPAAPKPQTASEVVQAMRKARGQQ